MVAIAGDAEFDEGNVFEAMLEAWKHDVRNVWWVIDYNRQSLDAVVTDRLFLRLDGIFRGMDWQVVTLKYGRALEQAFARRGGDALRRWIDECPNSRYSALAYKGGAAWRQQLMSALGDTSGIRELLDEHDDPALQHLMTNLGGHDLEALADAFHGLENDRPTCFLAYTIKGYGLPLAGHKDNHAGLMSPEQIETFKRAEGVAEGEEWEPFAGLDVPEDELRAFVESVPFAAPATRRHEAARVAVPEVFEPPVSESMSTQGGFGRLLADIARTHPSLADRIVTTSPDVTVSTNLGGWVNRRAIFDPNDRSDPFKAEAIASPQSWSMSPRGQHIELGIAENNLFILLAALGLAGPLFGTRLLPIGTVYDPFISRGLDALNYACYQDARFILVGTPCGHHARRRGWCTPVRLHPAHRYGAAGAHLVRARLRGRALRDPALGLRAFAGRGWRRGVSASFDATARAARARAHAAPARGHSRRCILARAAHARRRGRHCRLRSGRGRGARGARTAGGGPPGRRAPPRHLAGPAGARVA